ncbi:MAG: DEAD/DEAH box helicase, partial [Cytophagales bacterium]|nr:DEAD/DEAH box helicase [Cytophagales bacterium]
HAGSFRSKSLSQFSGQDLVITTYGTLRQDSEVLQNYYFNYVILDESQAIKNPTSITTIEVSRLRARNRLILTGTPVENTTLDLWSQMNFVNPGLLGTLGFFKKEFLIPIEKNHDDKRIKKLHSIIKPFILRRQKSQVATELPDKVENIVYTHMTESQEKEYEKAKAFYRNKILEEVDEKGVNNSRILLLQGLIRLRQLANHPGMVEPDYKGGSGKMEDVLEMLDNAIRERHKVLVFSQFVKHLDLLRSELDKLNTNYAYLDGATKDRREQVEFFQNNPEVPLFLISLKAGGTGLNLTAADYVFILDPWWNPAAEAQAVDRAHRIGQKNTVFTYKFITK